MIDLLISPDTCPADIDETAEAYYMKRLTPAEALSYREHYPGCERCNSAVKQIDSFIRALTVIARMGYGDTTVN